VYKAVFLELCVNFLEHDLRLAGRSSLNGTSGFSSKRQPIIVQFCSQGFQHCLEISLISFSTVSLHKRRECLLYLFSLSELEVICVGECLVEL
jgi:hypothetical protein